MEHIKINNDSIGIAVKDWLEDPLKAEPVYGHISGWDTSEVTDMGHLFSFAKQFNQPIGNWNVSNVTNMYCMFQNNTNFNQGHFLFPRIIFYTWEYFFLKKSDDKIF